MTVGPPDAPGSSYVVIDSILYRVESPSAALDIAFKAKFALDAAYPKESLGEWMFLQRAVYGIKLPRDKLLLKGRILALIEEYEAFNEDYFAERKIWKTFFVRFRPPPQ